MDWLWIIGGVAGAAGLIIALKVKWLVDSTDWR